MLLHIKDIITQISHDMRTLDIRNVCLQIYRHNKIRQNAAYFLRKAINLQDE